jgi:hypothetical protein
LSEVGTSEQCVATASELSPQFILSESFFIISVDAMFTTLMEPLFTNVFEVDAQISVRPCVWRVRISRLTGSQL